MITQNAPTVDRKLEAAINEVFSQMDNVDCASDEYAKMVDQLTKLYKMKEIDSKIKVTEFDSIGKQNNLNFEAGQKEIETRHRHEEAIYATDVRADELKLKAKEIESTCVLKEAETELKKKEIEDRRRVSADTLAIVGANIAGIIMIIGYEKFNVVTTKALGFVSKLR